MTVPDDADDNVIYREHPASDEEFSAVVVLAASALEADETGSALPPLWPMLLHFSSDFAPPTGITAEFLDANCIPQLIRTLRSPLLRHQHGGAIGMRKVLSREKSPPVNDAIAAGAVPLLGKLLENDNTPATQFEAAWMLAVIASGITDHTACIVNTPGLIASFVRLPSSADLGVREQAVWALGNIAGDSPVYRDLLLERGVLTELTDISRRLDLGMSLVLRRHMTWAISNLCRGKPAPPLGVIAAALPYLAAMIQYPDSEVVADALWSLSFISDGTSDRISAVLGHGTLPAIMHHLSTGAAKSIETPALRCLGNIVTGDDHQTALAIEHGAITVLCTTLRAQSLTTRVGTKKEALWALSNIAAGNAQQVNALLQAGVFDLIADSIAVDDQRIRKDAQWTVANALQGASPADRTAIIGSPPSERCSMQRRRSASVALAWGASRLHSSVSLMPSRRSPLRTS
jgi:hypothetical protein